MTGTEAAVAADVNGEATVEERLAAADRRIQALDRDVKVLGILVVGLVVAGVIAWVLNELAFSHPAPSNRDATEADLLTGGVHCYDSPEERAAARQRALAAIDRMEWERKLRTEPEGGQMWGTAAPIGPNEIPSIWDSPANLSSLNADPALCFSVQYLP